MSAEALTNENEYEWVQVNSCRVYCILWHGRNSHQAVFTINNLRTGAVTEQMCSMGLWHMEDELIPEELGLECYEPLTAVRYGHGAMFLQDQGGAVWYDVKLRTA